MQSISSIVDQALKRHSTGMPSLSDRLTNNLEFRLFFNINFGLPYKEAKKEFIKNYLKDILTLSLGNISTAAKKAHIHRRHLHRMINETDVDPDMYRREMLKPYEYMKTYVQNIVEDTLSKFDSDENIRNVYSNLEDISNVIAQNIDTLSFDDALRVFEKEFIDKALKDNNYDIKATARKIKIGQRTLYRKISHLGIGVAH